MTLPQHMVERAARAICVSLGKDPDGLDAAEICDRHNRPLPLWMAHEEQAIAAIQAACAEAAAEITRLRTKVTPQPIESAPKSTSVPTPGGHFVTGRYLLGYCPDEGTEADACWEVVWWEPHIDGGCWYNGSYPVRPTHWLPLPTVQP